MRDSLSEEHVSLRATLAAAHLLVHSFGGVAMPRDAPLPSACNRTRSCSHRLPIRSSTNDGERLPDGRLLSPRRALGGSRGCIWWPTAQPEARASCGSVAMTRAGARRHGHGSKHQFATRGFGSMMARVPQNGSSCAVVQDSAPGKMHTPSRGILHNCTTSSWRKMCARAHL